MKKFLICLLLTACDERSEYVDSRLEEPGEVQDLVYTPAQHGTGVGYSFAGKGGLVVTSIDVQAKYAVVFSCQHGNFVIEGSDKAYELWKRLKKNQHVTLVYDEKLQKDYFKDQLKKVHLLGYHLVDVR